MNEARDHWESVWSTRDRGEVSWHQATPTVSLELIDACGLGTDDAIVDVGGGASVLAARLLARGYRDVTVVDIAAAALDALDTMLASELGARGLVARVCSDLLEWQPDRHYALWHDRAVNHFLTATPDRKRYAALAAATVAPGGHVVLGVFAPDGPTQCSGLPVHRCEPDVLAGEFVDFEHLRTVSEQHLTPWQTTQSFQYLLLRRR